MLLIWKKKIVFFFSFVFLPFNSSPEKQRFRQKPTPPTVFNLQALDWDYCEEETSAYYQLSRITSKFVSFFLLLLNLLFCPPKMRDFQKIP